jgi:hypothetical protein
VRSCRILKGRRHMSIIMSPTTHRHSTYRVTTVRCVANRFDCKYLGESIAGNTRSIIRDRHAPWPRLRVTHSTSKRGLAKRAALDLAIPFSDKMDDRYEFDLESEMLNMRMRCNLICQTFPQQLSQPSQANVPTAKNLAYFR